MRGWTRGNVIMINRLHVITLVILLVVAHLAQAQTFTTLYSFTGGADGNLPEAGVIRDQLATCMAPRGGAAINTTIRLATAWFTR